MSKLYIYIDMYVYIKKYERERELNKDCHDLISSMKFLDVRRILLFDYGRKERSNVRENYFVK